MPSPNFNWETAFIDSKGFYSSYVTVNPRAEKSHDYDLKDICSFQFQIPVGCFSLFPHWFSECCIIVHVRNDVRNRVVDKVESTVSNLHLDVRPLAG